MKSGLEFLNNVYFVKVGHAFTDFLKSELCNSLGHPRIAEHVGMEAGETNAVALEVSVGSASGANLSGSGTLAPSCVQDFVLTGAAIFCLHHVWEGKWHLTLCSQTCR